MGVDTEQCASENVGPKEGGLWDPTSIGEGMSANDDDEPWEGMNYEILRRLERGMKHSL